METSMMSSEDAGRIRRIKVRVNITSPCVTSTATCPMSDSLGPSGLVLSTLAQEVTHSQKSEIAHCLPRQDYSRG